MKGIMRTNLVVAATVVLGMVSANGFADEGLAAQQATDTSDKTGTNPVNFQRDFRIYNEYSWLNSKGDGNQNLTTMEFRSPFAGGKWQFRTRVRASNSINADLNNDGSDDIDQSGLGDIDMRFLTVPYMNMAKREAVAVGLELFLDTASDATLGRGANSIGPQVFYVKFLPNGLFAPGLQYVFSVDEDKGRSDVDEFLIDLNYLRMANDKMTWFFTDPQIVIDNENDTEFAIVDFEFGWMMAKWYPEMKGHSFYIRPSIGVGVDRPTEGSVEVAYKVVGW
jgi:hypothetical protein